MLRLCIYSFLFVLLQSCIPNNNSVNTDVYLPITDVDRQKIVQLQDEQKISELYAYFSNQSPALRYYAVLAFASIKNESSADSLVPLLSDPIVEVRAAAAYALGQCNNPKVVDKLISAFSAKDTINVNNIFNCNILEAVGKLGDEKDLLALATIKTYRSTDTLLLVGQARSIVHMAVRGITNDAATSKMIDYLYFETTPAIVKQIAATYFSVAKNIDITLYKTRLTELLNSSKDANIRMAIATTMGRSKDVDFINVLKSRLIIESDFRVKCNIIRALGNFPYANIKETVIQNIKNENIHIASTAAGVLVHNGIAEDVNLYATYDTIGIPWQVRSQVCAALLSNTGIYFTITKNYLTQRIIKNITASTSPYEKSAYIKALGKDPFNYELLRNRFATEKDNLPKIACIEGLHDVLINPLFFKAFGNNYGRVKGEILATLIQAIESNDVGIIATACSVLKDKSLIWKEWIKDTDFLKEALAKLTLPKDIEAYNELKECIAYIEDVKFKPEIPVFNHPIDWTLLNSVSDTGVAAIKTSQGLIRVQLFRESAPNTVANFVDLVNQKYFNSKVFHRVVPNFVIQGGCPRGDGYGSLDYTIRSELPQAYFDEEGYIGMASAGNHTESVQWFITMSPAAHLNGKYTIFGKVIEGMDVVYKLQIGDKINEIILIK